MLYAPLHVLDRMLYWSPVWWGFTDGQERGDLDGITQRLARLGYLPLYTPLFEVLCNTADLFACILNNSWHVLHQLLPSIKNHSPFHATLQVS